MWCASVRHFSLLHYNSITSLLTVKPTLLHVRGAVPGRADSLGVSEVELRDEVLLENSLFALLTLEVRRRKDSINSVGSLCSSRWASCRCLCVRSLEMTCDSGMPNTWGVVSVWRVRAEQGDVKFIKLTGEMMNSLNAAVNSTCSIFHHLDLVFFVRLNKYNKRNAKSSASQYALNILSEGEHSYWIAFVNNRGKEERGWSRWRIGCNEWATT